jgi:NAD(P)-dependent dehydrogenase (short-subunit alcohol dehydrogenase family)
MDIGKNSKVLVIGGSSGIGFATAALAAEAGAAVTIASRSVERLKTAAAALPTGVMTTALDVTDADTVEQFFAATGEWDHVILSGASTTAGPARSFPLSDAHAAMGSKFWGAYHVGRSASIRAGGSLTFVSGVYSIRPKVEAVLQGAINAALEALARGLALELAPVRVNTVSPSITKTPLWDKFDRTMRDQMYREKAAQLPARRIGEPEDVAAAILLLAGNPFISGSTLLIDGGDALV